MVGLEQLAERRARARLQAAEVVERRSRSDSELAERIKSYRDGNVLTARDSEHVAAEIQAAAFELIDELFEQNTELYDRIEELEGAREKTASKSAGGKKK